MGRMASVRRKLREVIFFYRNLSEGDATPGPESEDVYFHLSAFLSAGRSITGFFCEEQNRLWFQDWKMRLTEGDRILLNYMVRQRNMEVHESGADVIPEFGPLTSREIESEGSSRSLPILVSSVATKYCFWIDGKQLDVNSTCRHYLELILKLVADFDKHLS
jgi:hypothetical protein